MEETPSQIGTALIQDLSDKLADSAHELLGIEKDKAEIFAQAAALRVARDWGGQLIYVPMDLVGRLISRNEMLYREFSGMNAYDLAKKYQLSVQQVYRIIKAMRAERTQKQHSLFD